MNEIYNENCLDTMKAMADNYLDSIVTDPPYGLSFMGKKWDYDVPSVEIWKECLRVLKPGGYLLSFAGTRTQHRMACNIEDAGFEIRDMIAWVYGSGFPKSLDIGKAIDKIQGNEREVVGEKNCGYQVSISKIRKEQGYRPNLTQSTRIVPVDKGNSKWEGWGTALKPAMEPITVARKPLSENTVAENVLKWGTGGINIDECRVQWDEKGLQGDSNRRKTPRTDITGAQFHASCGGDNAGKYVGEIQSPSGRFPANFIYDGSKEVLNLFPEVKSGKATLGTGTIDCQNNGIYNSGKGGIITSCFSDEGKASAARFFYCAKASKSERNAGLEDIEDKIPGHDFGTKLGEPRKDRIHTPTKNNHPTVKPVALIKYLIQLVTRPGGLVYDPFGGSGTLKLAAQQLGVDYIISEIDKDYCEIAENRKLEIQMKLF